MLSLDRKLGERVFIDCPDGSRIAVALYRLKRNGARLTFDAPREYRILREEVADLPEPVAEAAT